MTSTPLSSSSSSQGTKPSLPNLRAAFKAGGSPLAGSLGQGASPALSAVGKPSTASIPDAPLTPQNQDETGSVSSVPLSALGAGLDNKSNVSLSAVGGKTPTPTPPQQQKNPSNVSSSNPASPTLSAVGGKRKD